TLASSYVMPAPLMSARKAASAEVSALALPAVVSAASPRAAPGTAVGGALGMRGGNNLGSFVMSGWCGCRSGVTSESDGRLDGPPRPVKRRLSSEFRPPFVQVVMVRTLQIAEQ